jgi:cytochrome c-type biogenesis protein
MFTGPLAIGFAAGMLAAFNPCGFAMLPAYLSWFLGLESGGDQRSVGALRSIAVGAAVSLGFMGVFAAVGIVVNHFYQDYGGKVPYFSLVIGLLLIPIGVLRLLGRESKLKLRTWQRGAKDRTLLSMVLFGVSYATVSLSCTLPPFLATVAGAFRQESFAAGVSVFGAYAAGMAVVLISLTLALGAAKGSMVRHMRRILPYVGRVSGGLLVVAGAYVAYYGWYSLQLQRGRDVGGGPVTFVERISDSIARWMSDVGETRLGLILAVIVAIAAAATYLRRRTTGSAPPSTG